MVASQRPTAILGSVSPEDVSDMTQLVEDHHRPEIVHPPNRQPPLRRVVEGASPGDIDNVTEAFNVRMKSVHRYSLRRGFGSWPE